MPAENSQFAMFGLSPDELPAVAADDSAESEPLPACPCCGAEIAEEDGTEHNGELHCTDCVYTCEECSKTTTDSDDLHNAYTRSYWNSRTSTQCLCDSCAWKCDDCGEWFAEGVDKLSNSSGEPICARCAENYSTCEECNDTVCSDDSYFDEVNERTLCRSCYENRESDDEGESTRDDSGNTVIHGHWHKPRPMFYGAGFSLPQRSPAPGAVYFGCEIEVDTTEKRNRVEAIQDAGLFPNDFYHCEEDSSLDAGGDNSGFEIVSKPATWEHWQSVNLDWMDSLRRSGYRSYDVGTCGAHVHVSRSFFTEESLAALCLFVKHNRKLIKRLSRRGGGESSYATLERGGIAEIVRKVKAPSDSGNRYQAINLQNEHTVEFRFLRGTLNPASFRRNLALIVAMCHFAKFAAWGRNSWLSAEMFAQWIRTKGSKVLGKSDARTLSEWVEEAIAKQPAADVAA